MPLGKEARDAAQVLLFDAGRREHCGVQAFERPLEVFIAIYRGKSFLLSVFDNLAGKISKQLRLGSRLDLEVE